MIFSCVHLRHWLSYMTYRGLFSMSTHNWPIVPNESLPPWPRSPNHHLFLYLTCLSVLWGPWRWRNPNQTECAVVRHIFILEKFLPFKITNPMAAEPLWRSTGVTVLWWSVLNVTDELEIMRQLWMQLSKGVLFAQTWLLTACQILDLFRWA